MKSRIVLIFLLCSIIFTGCNKPLPDYSNMPFRYSITTIGDITVPANDTGVFGASLTLLSGDAARYPVTFSLKGLPAGVSAEKDTASFRLNYDLSSTFTAHNAAQGNYPMQAIFTDAQNGSKVVDFNLIVAPPTNRLNFLVGGYYPSNSCGNYIYASCQIDSVPGTPGKVMLVNRTGTVYTSYGVFDTCYGYVDCCTNTFTIPSQKVQHTTVEGNGTFIRATGYKRVILNRIITTDTNKYSCTVTLSQS